MLPDTCEDHQSCNEEQEEFGSGTGEPTSIVKSAVAMSS